MDLRPVLSSIQCPTLVTHRSGDRLVPVSYGRYLAEHIPGARMVELDGDTHAPQWGDFETPLLLTEEFMLGHASAPRQSERVLATVLFTDIVDSTARAAALGDGAWRQVLDRHDKICQSTVTDCGGRLVKVMRQEEWRGKADALENAFSAAVQRTDGVGPIRME